MRVPFVLPDGACRVCGRPVAFPGPELVCEDCTRHRPHFDRAASALRFEGEARRLVLDFKFRRQLWMRADFADWLEAASRARFDLPAVDCVVPVPSTRFHRLDRGYSPCEILSSALAERLGRRHLANALRRVGHPARQSTLSEDERRENVVGTVAVRSPADVRGRTVLTVDDIFTTGSTLSECARVLKEAGAWRVWCVSLARSVRD